MSRFVSITTLLLFLGQILTGDEVLQLTHSGQGENATAFFEISGTSERQNPVVYSLSESFEEETLFLHYRIRYRAEGLDSLPAGDGEFFVFWLDQQKGANQSTHSGGIPNIGIHVGPKGANRFMVRYSSAQESFGPVLEGDREYRVVARLEKKSAASDAAFSRLSLWVDPESEIPDTPDAVIEDPKALSSIRWVGFSTARKTEVGDRILIGDLRLASSWDALFSNTKTSLLSEIPAPPGFTPPAPPQEIAEVDPPPEEVTTDHWSFLPVEKPDIPTPEGSGWVRTPVDAFILDALERAEISHAPLASNTALTRRISLVLTGLPPKDVVPSDQLDAYIDTLLGSQAYGERWGRHWLDVARWAESNGHQHNRPRAHAWRYRDWVIDSFVAGKPYDQFLREQIAGDEIAPFHPDHVIATGFLAAARYSGNELDKAIQRNDILVDITNTTAKAFLGLTMECAQCHDHFFDPVTQWDYYHLMAYFAKGQPGDVILEPSHPEIEEAVSNRWGLFESVRSRVVERKRAAGTPEPVLVIPKSVPGAMTPVEKRTFAIIESKISDLPKAWAYYSPVTSPHDLEFAPTAIRWPLPFQKESLETVETRFLDRGNVTSTGPVVAPRWPQVFGGFESEEDRSHSRSELADWLTGPEHPLTARVWVNRIWQWHFGRGLVETSGDFGVAGAKPSHPELLDWLATELIESGWNTQHIQRLILRSNTFRQGSQFSDNASQRDPGNELLWRWTPRRLEAEAIRDSILAISGSLDESAGGPSIALASADQSTRRSLYLEQRRDNLPHQQMLFDSADALTSCAKRRVSTVSLQPLWLMNNPVIARETVQIANQLEPATDSEAPSSSAIHDAFQRILLRDPTDEERIALEELTEGTSLEEAIAVLFNLNEFLYIP